MQVVIQQACGGTWDCLGNKLPGNAGLHECQGQMASSFRTQPILSLAALAQSKLVPGIIGNTCAQMCLQQKKKKKEDLKHFLRGAFGSKPARTECGWPNSFLHIPQNRLTKELSLLTYK